MLPLLLITPMDYESALHWNDALYDVVFETQPNPDSLLVTLMTTQPIPKEDAINREALADKAVAMPTFWLPEWLSRPREGEGIDRYVLRVCLSLEEDGWYDESTGEWDSALEVFGASAEEALTHNLRLDIPSVEPSRQMLDEYLAILLDISSSAELNSMLIEEFSS